MTHRDLGDEIISRDPRLDPQPGDVLEGCAESGQRRYVQIHWVHGDEVGYRLTACLDAESLGMLYRMPLHAYLQQAKDAIVIARAETRHAS